MRQWIRGLLDRIDRWLAPVAASHRALANAYYALINPRFRREMRLTAAGRAAFFANRNRAPIALLRRNIHRLEKGLTMRPRSAVFAEGYIAETVLAFQRLQASEHTDPETLRWANDVLEEYFSIVTATPTIETVKTQFESLSRPRTSRASSADNWSPRARDENVVSGVGYEQFLALCHQRRSTRWFLAKPVPHELVNQALEAALQAPSACNRQPFFYRVLLESTEAADVASIAMGTAGYAHQIPTLIVVIGDFSCFEHERDRHVPYIDGSLATMQLMLALETLGLASCPINWPDIEHLERRMAARLHLEPFHRPIMLLALGYPDPTGGIAYSAKKTPEQIQRPQSAVSDR